MKHTEGKTFMALDRKGIYLQVDTQNYHIRTSSLSLEAKNTIVRHGGSGRYQQREQ